MTFFLKSPLLASPLPLLLCSFLILVSNGIVGRDTKVEAAIDPLPSTFAMEYSEMFIEERFEFFDIFLESYKETVDTIVDLQTSFWNFIPRYNSFDESKIDGMCSDKAHLYSSIPKFLREKRKSTTGTKSSGKSTEESNSAENEIRSNSLRYDRDADIDRYLKYLSDGCSEDIENNKIGFERYQKKCLDALRSIVYEPRCTTRYDSRVKCNGEIPTYKNSTFLPPAGELIREHFGKDSLNVVIIGAGPIGLLLANALSMLPQRQKQSVIPRVRILVLESRADAPGLKRVYSRNWQAHLSLLHFRNIIDPRVTKLFASMTEDKDYHEESVYDFVFPLNVIETILLLSNRDMGAAKFLFGIDPLELVDDLKNVQNLILVDGTGHRLEPLRRGNVCDGFGEDTDEGCDAQRSDDSESVTYNYRTPITPEITWLNEENVDFYENLRTFSVANEFSLVHGFLAKNGHSLHVAQSGQIMYPIDEETKAPKTMYWLDVHGATLTEEQNREEGVEDLYANGGALCNSCKYWYNELIEKGKYVKDAGEYYFQFENKEEERVNGLCEYMCYTEFFTSSTDLLRDDIHRSILAGRFNDTFVYQTDGWFPLMGYAFNPSTKLAHQIERVLEDHGYSDNPDGMPLRELYPALEGSMDTKQLSDSDLDMVKALKQITANFNTTAWPTATLNTQNPFIYTNGVKKKNKCKKKISLADHLEDVPMIRIGDSFTTGDGVTGAGLYTHATMIGVFMDIILHKTREA